MTQTNLTILDDGQKKSSKMTLKYVTVLLKWFIALFLFIQAASEELMNVKRFNYVR